MSSIFSAGEGAILGGAVGVGISTALEPDVEPAKQDIWKNNPYKVLEAQVLARLVAQGLVDFDPAQEQAQRSGFDANKFRALVELELAGPPIAEALELWRRGKISEEGMTHALEKAQIEPQYWAAIKELFVGRLDPAVIATAIQRGIMTDPGFLPVGPPSGSGNVKPFPVSTLDPIDEAKAHGIDSDRLFVETALVGLPLALQQAASAYFRGIITLDDFRRAVAEGNTRNEWGEAALEQARQILTASQYAELQLRGFLTEAERRTLTDQTGMSHANSDLLYDLLGRSIPVHQITTGEARGGVYGGPFDTIPDAYLSSLRRGNLRPEFYNLAYANRYSYPSAFFFRLLLTTGAISAADAEQAFLDIGWSPHWAKLVSESLAAKAAVTKHPNVTKAENQLWTATHRAFLNHDIDEPGATAELNAIHADPTVIPAILALWTRERDLQRKTLTAAQVKKAYKEPAINAATNAPWTLDEAIAALVDLGYSVTDAESFLNI